ncbi:MAG: hypothetical protein JNM80_05695 [Phycisphaerae bacterium]|nr:hypothetical protein [Phycisphaerae bacterium]
MPFFTDEQKREIASGELVLGGCCIDDSLATRLCHACGHRWRRFDGKPGPAY